MMENPVDKPRTSDELDFRQFFSWIRQGLNNTGRSILYGLATVRNLFFTNRLFFAGIIIGGLLLGAAYSELLKKKFYRTSMVISCDYLNTQILKNTIDKLNLLAGEPNGVGLMKILQIEKETATNIQSFQFLPFVSEDDVLEMEVLRTQLNNLAADKKDIIEKVVQKLTIDNKNAYQISVNVYSPDVVEPLEKALIKYLSETEYINKRVKINRANLENRRIKIVKESQKLDSLKDLLLLNLRAQARQPNRASTSVILSDNEVMDPLDVFAQDLELNRELLDIERQLYVKQDFEIVDGFTTLTQPESAGLFRILVIAFFVSVIIGYLIIGAWKFDSMLAKIDTKSK
jgi:hypothetical protein